MRKLAMYSILVVVAVAGLAGCNSVTPGPGEEAVLTMKPIFAGHGGIDETPVKTGRTFVAITTEAVIVNMLPQQFSVHFDDFMSSDGVPLDFDAVIRLRVKDSVALISQFGPKWYENNIHAEFANRVRQAVRKHGMNETAISTAAIEDIDTEITNAMVEYIAWAKLPVELIQITVGKANPPDAIKNQRIETASQQQRVLTEGQRDLAEQGRKKAEASRAAADNAYREAMNLSPDQFLTLEYIKALRETCSHNNGCTFILGGGEVSSVMDVARRK